MLIQKQSVEAWPRKGSSMKSEVRSLEQAVCALVTKLDLLLGAELGLRLLKASDGLHISTPDHLSEHRDDAFVTIHPSGWPKDSYIRARFYRSIGFWRLHECGEIWAEHLAIPVHTLRFKPADNLMGITLEPSNTVCKNFVSRGYGQLIESLQEDAKKHN
jgi:hypothetical protein